MVTYTICQLHNPTHRSASRRVPLVVAVGPGQHGGEGREEEAQRPRDDHVVVEVHVERDQHHRVPDTCVEWCVPGTFGWCF